MKATWALACVMVLGSRAWGDDYLSYKMISSSANPFPVYVDSRSASPAGISQASMQNAVERAWATWNAVSCSSAKVRSLGPTGGTVPNPLRTNDSYSVTPIWMLTNDADAREIFGGSSFIISLSLPRQYAGVLQTCDVFFNGVTGAWSADTTTPAGRFDVETVMLHEAGHCLGLNHFGPFTAVMFATVSPGESVRVLTQADTQHLCERYPATGASGGVCDANGGCLGADLKCLPQPVTNGVSLSLCSKGCGLGLNAQCELPTSCQASSAFAGFNGACLLPGTSVTAVGKACTNTLDCGSGVGVCRLPEAASQGNQFWIDGYCTQRCEPGQPECPAGSSCVPLDVGRLCTQDCRVGLADCRPGYACAPIDAIGTSGVCIPRCYTDTDCADSAHTTCRTCDGLCVNRQNISGQIGDVCTADAECGAGQLCRATSTGSAQKQCTVQCARGCAACPTSSTCTPTSTGELYCLRDCTGPGTCPLGLRCTQTSVGQSCVPACQSDGDCAVGESCSMGECVNPATDGSVCGTLCVKPDSGPPIVVTPKDGGVGTGGSLGCGCASIDVGSVMGAVLLLLVLSRRRA